MELEAHPAPSFDFTQAASHNRKRLLEWAVIIGLHRPVPTARIKPVLMKLLKRQGAPPPVF